MSIRELKHRLSREFYKGSVSVAFTLCVDKGACAFTKAEIVDVFSATLAAVIAESGCIVPAYCFMPDHQHLILTGTHEYSDTWTAVVRYKQKTGFWMSGNTPALRWQKDFYDHVIRRREDLAAQALYILDNPVRRGLVSSWQAYPFKGSIGCSLEDVLRGIM